MDFSKFKSFTEIINKVWLPNALLYGVAYETFWKLNPRKLEPFRIKREMEVKEQATTIDTLAWTIGSYVTEAMAVFWAKNNPSYPEKPRNMNSTDEASKGEVMTDGARFAAFAAEHNKQIRQRKSQS